MKHSWAFENWFLFSLEALAIFVTLCVCVFEFIWIIFQPLGNYLIMMHIFIHAKFFEYHVKSESFPFFLLVAFHEYNKSRAKKSQILQKHLLNKCFQFNLVSVSLLLVEYWNERKRMEKKNLEWCESYSHGWAKRTQEMQIETENNLTIWMYACKS